MTDSPPPQLNHIAKESLRERILEVLRDAILSGEFKPGQQLIETELASQLGVSRAPLREALQILGTEGLVETVPYHGTTVRKLTRTDIEELYSLRIVLESFAIQRIIAFGRREDVAHLQSIFEVMLDAAERSDLKEVSRQDRVFHDKLIDLASHSLLRTSWNTVTMRVRQVMALRNRRNSDITQIARNHLPIIEAIAKANEPLALVLIREHAESAADLIIDGWEYETQELDSL